MEAHTVAVLRDVHQYTGYVVVLVVLVSAVMGSGRAKDAREFTPGPYVFAAVVLDIQVLLGLIIYGSGRYWQADEPLIAYIHPAAALLALLAAHIGVRRARTHRMAVDAHRTAARGLVIALVLALAAVAASTLAVRTNLGT